MVNVIPVKSYAKISHLKLQKIITIFDFARSHFEIIFNACAVGLESIDMAWGRCE